MTAPKVEQATNIGTIHAIYMKGRGHEGQRRTREFSVETSRRQRERRFRFIDSPQYRHRLIGKIKRKKNGERNGRKTKKLLKTKTY